MDDRLPGQIRLAAQIADDVGDQLVRGERILVLVAAVLVTKRVLLGMLLSIVEVQYQGRIGSYETPEIGDDTMLEQCAPDLGQRAVHEQTQFPESGYRRRHPLALKDLGDLAGEVPAGCCLASQLCGVAERSWAS